MDSRVWSKALLYDFIESYKYHKCLWLKTNKFYYNKKKKTKAYKDLVNLIQDDFPNADELFVKTKIKNIRCAFRKVYKKKQKSQKIQESTIYEPKLWYFDLLMFTVVDDNNPATTNDGHDDENGLEAENNILPV